MYILLNNDTGIWYKVNPAKEKANPLAILLNNKYIIDSANKFILQFRIKYKKSILKLNNEI